MSGLVGLAPLQRLAAREAERRVGEQLDGGGVARLGQLGEGACEEVVARRSRRRCAVRGPGSRAAASVARAVDEIVVHERRHVDELHGDARGERWRPVRGRGQEDEHRAQALAARCQGVRADRGHGARMAAHGVLQALLELVEVPLEPRDLPDCGECGAHSLTAVWSATMPPANVR